MNRIERNVTAFFVGVVLIMAASIAYAGGMKEPPPEPITLQQDQYQDQYQDQHQGQDQQQDQDQSQGQEQSMGDMTGGTQTMSFTNESQAHSAIAPNVFATAPCFKGGSGALGVKGFNIGGGRVTVDPECELRETARMLGALGERELAVMVVCKTKAAISALGAICKPNASKSDRIKELEGRIQFMLTERDIERAVCDESIERCESQFRK